MTADAWTRRRAAAGVARWVARPFSVPDRGEPAWGLGLAGPDRGADGGPLAGRTVAIKDNVAVAGVPMRNGTALVDGYVPDEDAHRGRAMNVPCAMSDGLRVGMMVGRHAVEATILRAADAFERQVFRPDPPTWRAS